MMGEVYPSQEQEVSDHDLLLRFGINAVEAEQLVQYREHTGTLRQALLDPKCPLGDAFEQAHTDGGVEAVRETLGHLEGAFRTSFGIVISEKSAEDYENARSHASIDAHEKKN